MSLIRFSKKGLISNFKMQCTKRRFWATCTFHISLVFKNIYIYISIFFIYFFEIKSQTFKRGTSRIFQVLKCMRVSFMEKAVKNSSVFTYIEIANLNIQNEVIILRYVLF